MGIGYPTVELKLTFALKVDKLSVVCTVLNALAAVCFLSSSVLLPLPCLHTFVSHLVMGCPVSFVVRAVATFS